MPNNFYDGSSVSRFKFTEFAEPNYAPEIPLKAQIFRHKGQNEKTNNFCAIGLISHFGSGAGVLIFWHEKKLSIFLENFHDEDATITAMATLEGIPYDRDVAIETQVEGFPYTHSRAYMQKLLRDCENHGEQFTIEPFTAPERCADWETCEDKLGWQPKPIL